MTKKTLLKLYYDRACHNLLSYSANYIASKPKQEYINEWNMAKQEVELLSIMIAEHVDKEFGGEIAFEGTISAFHTAFNEPVKEQYIKLIEIVDNDGNRRLCDVDYEVGKDMYYRSDTEHHERYDQDKLTVIIFKIKGTCIKGWKWKES